MTSLKSCLPPKGSSNWHRNSIPDDSTTTSIRHAIIREVWLEKRPSPHAVYKIEIMSNSSHWFVFRRYKEFYNLHQILMKKFGIPKEFLPPKKLTNNMAIGTLEARREALEHYLQKLINSCDREAGTCPELLEFLDLKGHDVSLVVKSLSIYIGKHGERILANKELYSVTPVQLHCLTKQLQLPHPSANGDSIDLGNVYGFIAMLERLCVMDTIAKATNGKQFEINYSYDLGLFPKLIELQIENCRLSSAIGFHILPQRLKSLTVRYCLHTMKEFLIDCAAEKRPAPLSKNVREGWRTQAAFRLSNKRIIVQPWVCLTSLNMTHNNILGLDNSIGLLPAIRELDLSYNKFAHLDLSLLEDSPLQKLLLVGNEIYLISGSTKTLNNLRVLNLRQNRVQSVEGLLCAQGLTQLDLSFNSIVLLSEARKLAALEHLGSLSINGNPMARQKRHRIMIFASFRDRQLELDGRQIGRKEQAKLDARFANDEEADFDDTMSISTVSDDDMDSGIDGHVSALEPLFEEDDYIVVDKDVNLGSLAIGEGDESGKVRGSSFEGSYSESVDATRSGSPAVAQKKPVMRTAAFRAGDNSNLESFSCYRESLAANWKPDSPFRVDRSLHEEMTATELPSNDRKMSDQSIDNGRMPSVRKRTTEGASEKHDSHIHNADSAAQTNCSTTTPKEKNNAKGNLPKNPSLTSFDKIVRNSKKKKERKLRVDLWHNNGRIGSPTSPKERSAPIEGACSPQLTQNAPESNKYITVLPEIEEFRVEDAGEDELWNGEENCEPGLECIEVLEDD